MNLRENEHDLTICFFRTLQFDAQVYSDVTNVENSGCKNCRGQRMEEARDKSNVEFGEKKSQEQEGSTKRQRESPLFHTVGHTSLKKSGVRTKIT